MALYVRYVPVAIGGGGGGGSTPPGGSNGEIQYNSFGSFGGDTSTTDGAGNITATSLTADGLITAGTTSGNVTIESVTGTYDFILPATVGATGYLLTSDAGAGAMTWTDPASVVPSQVTVTRKTDNADYYLNFISGNTTGSYGLDVGTNLFYNPGTNMLTVGTGGSVVANLITGNIQMEGAGIITLQAVSGGVTTYNFNLPETAGSSGQLLTSGGGVGGAPMTWTTASAIVPAQSTVTQQTSGSTFYPVFISGNTTGTYGLDVGTALSYVPSSGLLASTSFLAGTQIQTPELIMTGPIDILGSSSGDISIKAQAAAGTYNFNLPITAGTATYLLTSQGGSTSAMTWTNPASFQPAGNYITALTGDVTATGPGSVAATLATVNSNVGTFASVTVNGKGLVTAATALSGDITSSSAVTTLATVNSNVGSFTNASITVNGKGLVTAASNGTAPVTSFTGDGIVLNNSASTGAVTATLATHTAGTYLGGPYSGSAATPTFKAFQPPTIQKFTSGSGTYTTATGALYIRVRMSGGGGGGHGSGITSGNGGTGGTTTFGTTLLSCVGGTGGTGDAGGAGGTASLGSGPVGTALSGGSGSGASSTSVSASGAGGNNPLGGAGGGVEVAGTAIAGKAGAANTGSGGSSGGAQAGVSSVEGSGGAGGYIDAIITSPSATYAYAVGAGGTAGTLGTSGAAGGAGGSGVIEVTEYYQ